MVSQIPLQAKRKGLLAKIMHNAANDQGSDVPTEAWHDGGIFDLTT